MKKLLYKYAGLFLIVLIFAGCMKEPVYPKEPHIELKEVITIPKKRVIETVIILKFRDGDGNLGLAKGDTLGKFERIIDPITKEELNKFNNNYFIEPFIEKNGEFVPAVKEFPKTANLVYNSRFLPLSPDDKPRTLEGELKFTFDIFKDLMPGYFKSGHHVKFRIQIADRDLNLSNIVETEPIPIFF